MQSQKILFVVVFKLTKYALSFIFFYLMVLFYEPYVIGTVKFTIALVTIFSFIFNLGFSVAHLKIYPEEEDKAACIGTLLIFKGIFISISLVFYLSLLSLMNFETIILNIMIIFIFEQIMQGINSLMSNILIADDEIIKGTFPWVVISSSKIILIIIGLFLYPTNELTLAFIYLISTLVHTGFLVIYIFSYKVKLPTINLLRRYLHFTYPLIVSNIAVLISGNIGIILINFWISTDAVAYYYAGDHLSVFRTIIPNVIGLVMISIFSKNIKEKNIEKNEEIIKKLSKYFCFLWGGIVLLSFLYSDEVIIIFLSETYRPSIVIFNILILAHFVEINDIGVYTDLKAKGLTKIFSLIKFIGEIYNILLIIYFLAPFGLNLGINGLALSVLIKYITYTPVVRLILWLKYGYGYNFSIFLYLFAGILVFWLNSLYTANLDLLVHFYLLPIFIIIDIALYIGILYAIRGLKKEDFRYFKSFLNIKSLINLLYNDLAIKNNLFEDDDE